MHHRPQLAAALTAFAVTPLLGAALSSPALCLPALCLPTLCSPAQNSTNSSSGNSPSEAPSALQCSIRYVRPGEEYRSPEGVVVTNRSGALGHSVRVESFPADSTHARPYVVVNIPRLARVEVSGLETGDTVTVDTGASVTIVGSDFGDNASAPGKSVATGGVNVLGNKAVIRLRGSNNDVDFRSGSYGSRVVVEGGGTNNDIDLNGTDNQVDTPHGQNIHD